MAGSWTVAHHVIVLILSLIWTPEWLCRVCISWFHSGCFKSKITLISYFCSLLVSFTTALCYFICWFFIAHVKQTPFNITLLVIHVQNVCLVEWAKVHGTQYVEEVRVWCEHFYCHSLNSNYIRKLCLFHQSYIYVKIHLVNKLFLFMIFLLFLIP